MVGIIGDVAGMHTRSGARFGNREDFRRGAVASRSKMHYAVNGLRYNVESRLGDLLNAAIFEITPLRGLAGGMSATIRWRKSAVSSSRRSGDRYGGIGAAWTANGKP
jgi:hypothetical protein